MKKLMGTAALAAMIVMGQGVSVQAEQDRRLSEKRNKQVVEAPGQGGENPSDNDNVGLNAGCGNGGEHGDPGNSLDNNNAGDDGSLEKCAGTPQSDAAPE